MQKSRLTTAMKLEVKKPRSLSDDEALSHSVVVTVLPDEDETSLSKVSCLEEKRQVPSSQAPLPAARSGGMSGRAANLTREPNQEEIDILVNLEKSDASGLGLDVSRGQPQVLVICRINPGPVMDYNMLNPANKIKVDDHIYEINGMQHSHDLMMRECRSSEKLQMRIRRYLPLPGQYKISVCKPSDGLGLEIGRAKKSMRIESIRSGPIQDWNNSASDDVKVQAGDYILEVNHVRGDFYQLVAAVKKSSATIDLVMARGMQPDSRLSAAIPVPENLQTSGDIQLENEPAGGYFTLDISDDFDF